MSLYTTLMKRGHTEKEASHIATQMINRFSEAFAELDPVWVMHELDEELVSYLREELGKEVYWFEVHEEKYFDGGIRVPYCVLMYDMDRLKSSDDV